MALHLYRRHRTSCPHRAQTYRRCSCPIYVKVTLNKSSIRLSLDQTDWDAATTLIGQWTKSGRVGQLQTTAKPLTEAMAAFQHDAEARALAASTRLSYAMRLRALQAWADREGYVTVADVTLERLTQFRTTWTTLAPLTRTVWQQFYVSFFKWCMARQWIDQNPAAGLRAIKRLVNPTLPFTPAEMTAILTACDRYAAAHPRQAYLQHIRAFVLLLRWTGLRISDVVRLTWPRVRPDGTVFLYTQKTGTPVVVPIPADALAAWAAVPRRGAYPFWTGVARLECATAYWQWALREVFATAGIEGGHAHRFRDTFAVECLLAGVDLTDVSILLGHSSTKITERHYLPWVRARQSRLEAAVRASWGAAPAPAAPSTADTPAAGPTR